MTSQQPLTDEQLTPAEIRLAQYGQRTSTWSTATYNDGTEKALHEIALGLKAEVDRLRAQRRYLIDQLAKKDAASGEADRKLREFLAGPTEEPETAEPTRTLTESEYNAAWHAVEGAAGEEHADPGTVLHAVLDRLGINLPPAPPVHACPPVGSGVTPCCGRTPFELPRTDRMETDPELVTCTGQGV